MKQSKRMIVDLMDPWLNAYVNYGDGLEKDDIFFKNYGIEFKARFEMGVTPTYVVEIGNYLKESGLDLQNITSIRLVAAAYDENGNEIDREQELGKWELVSEDAMDGYSDSDILPLVTRCGFGSNVITKIDTLTYTGYKADGITFCTKSLEDIAGINIQLFTVHAEQIERFVITKIVVYMEQEAEMTQKEKVIEADLNDPALRGFMNLGKGPVEEGVLQIDGVMIFENPYDEELYCMLGVDFREYLKKLDVRVEELTSIEIQLGVYDATGAEISFADNYQKCAFVSAESLNGYSDSDILESGNYKLLGAQVTTVIDLRETDHTSMPHRIEEGAGINIQILNGDRSQTKYASLNQLRFIR